MSDWIIRKAELADASGLVACIDAAYAVYRGRIHDLPDVSGGISDDISRNVVHVAEIAQIIVGGSVLIVKPDHVLLANIAVHPDAGGRGVGRALVENVDRQAKLLGLSEMRLSTHVDMPENVALYEHLGWKVTGKTGNKVLMAKFAGPALSD